MAEVQHRTLTDDEFERAVYAALGAAGSLPVEVVKELARRNAAPSPADTPDNSRQLTLPFSA